MTSAGPVPRRRTRLWQGLLWALVALLVSMVVAVRIRFAPNPLDPVYQGRRLSAWMQMHPREYGPACQSIGTNALPYLLQELQFKDPAWLLGVERALGRFEAGPFWETARMHQYRARLALQQLDTNAVPALLDAALSRPLVVKADDLPYEAAFALTWMASPDAKRMIEERLAAALADPHTSNAAAAARAVIHPK